VSGPNITNGHCSFQTAIEIFYIYEKPFPLILALRFAVNAQ